MDYLIFNINKLIDMKEKIEDWRSRLTAIQNEIDSTVKSDWDRIINQDTNGDILFEQNVKFRESVRYRRHIVQLLDSIDDNFELCQQAELILKNCKNK
jgi:hypothetical protein